ncbi:4-diphosphocytidyl-2-C-methyl-D-erythritol kinase [Geotalea uraniireducens]|uniref:4-diphosphocytidyl-2-C-methyl-D-erythritol kinase n=2 Tax=Geotalea uraniireducens TaxID=351604 RepID=A0ABN6VP58_9BACT|nr:4-diphosphocytidyl-2-C-methyl-D-erythritol kinase [Geotalea uraniireducens]
MQRIDLCDDIVVAVSPEPGIRVSCGSVGVPNGPENIAWRAADALLRHSGVQTGLDIGITKHIPVAAGLGGGSSDGASVLMGVNELLGLGISDRQLMEIGVKLGADVPFFIFKRTAIAEGIGEVLTAVEHVPPAWLVIVNPRVHVSTAWVYQNLQLTNLRPQDRIPRFYKDIGDLVAVFANDLESVTIPRYPVIGEIKKRLLATGCRGALMSGSGPTVFGICDQEAVARKIAGQLSGDGWFVEAVQTL